MALVFKTRQFGDHEDFLKNKYKKHRRTNTISNGVLGAVSGAAYGYGRSNGKCACCNIKFEFGNKDTTPNVDHCHSTLILRGLLCKRCNSVLGYCEDDVVILENLARYLRKWHG